LGGSGPDLGSPSAGTAGQRALARPGLAVRTGPRAALSVRTWRYTALEVRTWLYAALEVRT